MNCWEDYSRFSTLYRVFEGINRTLDIHRQSTPTDVLLDRLHDYTGPPYVVILDEVDQIDDTDVLGDQCAVRSAPVVTTLVLRVRNVDRWRLVVEDVLLDWCTR